jgi:hypothetical protein
MIYLIKPFNLHIRIDDIVAIQTDGRCKDTTVIWCKLLNAPIRLSDLQLIEIRQIGYGNHDSEARVQAYKDYKECIKDLIETWEAECDGCATPED